jgi:hypothetical protein
MNPLGELIVLSLPFLLLGIIVAILVIEIGGRQRRLG